MPFLNPYSPGQLPNVVNGFQQSPEFAGGINGALSGANFGGVTRGQLYGYKTDPSTAVGSPYAQFLTGGQGSGGPINFGLGRAMQYARSGGIVGPGAMRAARENRQASPGGNWGVGFGPNGGGDTQPNGIMYANGAQGGAVPGGAMALNPNAGAGSYGAMPGSTGMPPGMKLPTGVYTTDGGPTAGQPGGTPGTYGGSTGIVPSGTPQGWLGANPMLTGQLSNMGQVIAQQFGRNVLPQIRSNAIMAGGYGGSKQGIAEGLGAQGAMDSFARYGTDLLGSDWTNEQNRDITRTGQAQQFYSDQRAQDRADLQTGASLYDQGTQGYWSPLKNASSIYSPYTGFGPQTSSSSQGGGWLGALGGAGAAAQLLNGFKWG
jgi:hypothetical protein